MSEKIYMSEELVDVIDDSENGNLFLCQFYRWDNSLRKDILVSTIPIFKLERDKNSTKITIRSLNTKVKDFLGIFSRLSVNFQDHCIFDRRLDTSLIFSISVLDRDQAEFVLNC